MMKKELIEYLKTCKPNRARHDYRTNNTLTKIYTSEDGWEYTILPKGTILYRGTKDEYTHKERATYFSTNIMIAYFYLKSYKGPGKLNVFKLKNDLKLFKFDSIINANKLAEETFDSDIIVEKKRVLKKNERLRADAVNIDKKLYDCVYESYGGKPMYLQKLKESEELHKKPFQITKLFRNSFYNCDFAISNWICDHGFNGYDAKPILRMPSIRNDPKHPNFPEETVLCNPEPNLSHIKSYTLKYTKDYQTNEKILKQLADIQQEVNEL